MILVPIIASVALAAAGSPSRAIACRMDAFSPAERARHAALIGKLSAAVARREELPDGFAFDVPAEKMSLTELAEWVSLEARCCPFLDFAISLSGSGGPSRLCLTGSPGVKEFLAEELSGK